MRILRIEDRQKGEVNPDRTQAERDEEILQLRLNTNLRMGTTETDNIRPESVGGVLRVRTQSNYYGPKPPRP